MSLDVCALGELLIDFTQAGTSENGMNLFEQNPGGAPANALSALAHLGMKTAFVGKVGADMHGRFLQDTLAQAGIDTTGLVMGTDAFTTLAFVALAADGQRSFSFARKPGADIMLTKQEVDLALVAGCRVFHFGSLSLTDEPARSATLYAIEKAKAAGAVLSYDPNYRASLWPDEDTAKKQMRSLIPYADILKISDEETGLLTGHTAPEAAAQALLEAGVSCVIVTRGKDGALACTKGGLASHPGFAANAVDTTGAGDAFLGGFLYKLLSENTTPGDLSQAQLLDFITFANAVAGLCVERRGAILAMPTLEEVRARWGV